MGTSIPLVTPAAWAVTIATADDAASAGFPENPTGFVVFATFKRKVAGKPTTFTPELNLRGDFSGVPDEEVTLTLNPTHFEYTSSVSAMTELRLTVPDPEYQLIDHLILEEDLGTDVTLRFGFIEGANMSESISMVFYKQEPHFPASGHVETVLVCYDHMIFFTLPFEPSLIEDPKGVSINDMVKLVNTEVMRAYGRTLDFVPDPRLDEKKWWRMHKVGKENVKAPSVHKTALDGTARATSVVRSKAGNPLEFLYGLLAIAANGGERIELFVENGALFFRPVQLGQRTVIAHYRYFSELDSASPQFNRLLSFSPEVAMKPRLTKVQTVDPATGGVESAQADNDTKLDRPNLAKSQNAVRRVGVQEGGATTVQLERGGSTGDQKGKHVETTTRQKTYTVKSGDSIDGVAKKLGVQADLIITWNHLTADGSTDRTKVVLTPGRGLTYYLPEPKPSTDKADTNDSASTPTVTSPEARARANRAYLTEEFKGVKAKAQVEGHPALRAGWPIYIGNVGKRWEGPWYIEEVKHTADESGYFCDLQLSRDGFMIAREQGDNSGFDPKSELQDTDPDAVVPAAAQLQKMRRVGVQSGGSAVVNRVP